MSDELKPVLMITHVRRPAQDNDEGEAWQAKLIRGDEWILGRDYRTRDAHGPDPKRAEDELLAAYSASGEVVEEELDCRALDALGISAQEAVDSMAKFNASRTLSPHPPEHGHFRCDGAYKM